MPNLLCRSKKSDSCENGRYIKVADLVEDTTFNGVSIICTPCLWVEQRERKEVMWPDTRS